MNWVFSATVPRQPTATPTRNSSKSILPVPFRSKTEKRRSGECDRIAAAAVNCRPGRHAQPQAHLPSCQGAGRILEMCPCPPSCRGSARTDPGDGRVQRGPGRAPAGRWRRPYLKCLLQDPELAGVDWCAGEAVVRRGSPPPRQRRHPGRVRPHVHRCVHCLNSASLARLVTVPIAGGLRAQGQPVSGPPWPTQGHFPGPANGNERKTKGGSR